MLIIEIHFLHLTFRCLFHNLETFIERNIYLFILIYGTKKMIIKQNPKIFMEHSVPFWKGLRTMEKGREKPFCFLILNGNTK